MRTPEDVYQDFAGRRQGILTALTVDVDRFYTECDPDRENLCLYGNPDSSWEVDLPAEEVPPEMPEPALGINFARDGMQVRPNWRCCEVSVSLGLALRARGGFDTTIGGLCVPGCPTRGCVLAEEGLAVPGGRAQRHMAVVCCLLQRGAAEPRRQGEAVRAHQRVPNLLRNRLWQGHGQRCQAQEAWSTRTAFQAHRPATTRQDSAAGNLLGTYRVQLPGNAAAACLRHYFGLSYALLCPGSRFLWMSLGVVRAPPEAFDP